MLTPYIILGIAAALIFYLILILRGDQPHLITKERTHFSRLRYI